MNQPLLPSHTDGDGDGQSNSGARLAKWKAKREEKVQDNAARRKAVGASLMRDNEGFGIVVADSPSLARIGAPVNAPPQEPAHDGGDGGGLRQRARPRPGLGSDDADGVPAATPVSPKRERLQSLDAVRGLNVLLMVFVDDYGIWAQSWIDHSPWDRVHLADFVMPLFLFMVGVSMAFSMQKYSGPGLKWRVLKRTLKLFVLGCLTQGASWRFGTGKGIDIQSMRVPGILQRIAFAYCAAALMKLYLPVYTASGFRQPYTGSFADAPPWLRRSTRVFVHYGLHWLVALAFFALYLCLVLFLYVPTWEYTDGAGETRTQVCDVRGDLTPACSATRRVDTWLVGEQHLLRSGRFKNSAWCSACAPYGDHTQCPHLHANGTDATPAWCYARLDPEGILSSVPTVLTTWLGQHFGLVLVHYQGDHNARLQHLGCMSLVLLILGWAISFAWPMNKQIWSPAYLFGMAGACGALLLSLYCVYDLQELHREPVAAAGSPSEAGRGGELADVAESVPLPGHDPTVPSDTDSTPRARATPRDGGLRAAQRLFRPCTWVGMNTLLIYMLAASGSVVSNAQSWLYFNGDHKQTLRHLAYTHGFCNGSHFNPEALPFPGYSPGARILKHPIPEFSQYCGEGAWFFPKNVPESSAMLAWVLLGLAWWAALAGYLHRAGWYWTV
jgi:hypothetical protein